jgi:protein-S-isoprenylcysteine O-methyltransferase Ste14
MSTETLFRLLFSAIFLSAFATAFIHRASAHVKGGSVSQKEEGKLMLPLRLIGLAGWLSVLVYMINPRWMAWSSFSLPDGFRWAGAALALAGFSIAVTAARAIGKNVTRTVVTREDHELVTSGPYRYIRHPLYTAGMFLSWGLGLLAANWFILGAWLIGFVLIVLRLPNEEAHLIAAFGDDYRAYIKRTGAFTPRLTGKS